MCKYLMERPFCAIDRIDSRPKCEFYPASREFSHLGCAEMRGSGGLCGPIGLHAASGSPGQHSEHYALDARFRGA
jgi:hypothetical protein